MLTYWSCNVYRVVYNSNILCHFFDSFSVYLTVFFSQMKRWKAGEMTLRAALEMNIHVLIYWDSRCWTDVSLSTNLIVILICYHSSPSTTFIMVLLEMQRHKTKRFLFFLQKIKSEPRVLFQRVCLIQAYKSLVSVQVQASWDPKEHKTAWTTKQHGQPINLAQ